MSLCIHMPASAKQRRQTINLRISGTQKALIDKAAEVSGRNRSEFMLDAASREAETVLLDRRYFLLPDPDFERFLRLLDKPSSANSRLQRLLRDKPAWER